MGRAWRGVCVAGWRAWLGGGACMPGDTVNERAGTHPTGMHSCLLNSVPYDVGIAFRLIGYFFRKPKRRMAYQFLLSSWLYLQLV